jgi:hypothetical protein
MRVDNSAGKGTSGMDKFSSKVHKVHMELGGKLLNSLRIKTQFLERLQSVSVVAGAAHTQKDDVESNGGSLNVAKFFVLFLCSVQLVLRSGAGALTVLDLDEVDVTPRFAEVFGSVLSGIGGSAGGWRCCWGAPSLPQLPPATPKNTPPYISLLYLFFATMGVTSTKSGRLEVNLSLFGREAEWEEPFGSNSTFSCTFQESGGFAWSSVRCCLYSWRQRMILRSLIC